MDTVIVCVWKWEYVEELEGVVTYNRFIAFFFFAAIQVIEL